VEEDKLVGHLLVNKHHKQLQQLLQLNLLKQQLKRLIMMLNYRNLMLQTRLN
jgi:hypothetical protein